MAGTQQDLKAELDALKERVRALAETQAASEGEVDEASVPEGAGAQLTQQMDDLVELLKQEIDDIPVMTGVAIFGLGVLMGRLLAR